MRVLVAQLCLTLCNLMDCSPPGCFVHGILQARILEWVAIPFSICMCIFQFNTVMCQTLVLGILKLVKCFGKGGCCADRLVLCLPEISPLCCQFNQADWLSVS